MRDRLAILDLIESGQISVDEGVRRLAAANGAVGGAPGEFESVPGSATAISARGRTAEAPAERETRVAPTRPGYVRILWQIMFNLGIAGLAGGGMLIANAYGREGRPGLAWAWLILATGLLMMLVGWWLNEARWLAVRVQERSGRRFAISLPIPLRLVTWTIRVVSPFIPQLRGASLDELIIALQDELRQGRPLAVHVDEGDNGDRVQIHFG